MTRNLRILLLVLCSVGIWVPSASADFLVYTWMGTVTGSGYYAEWVPPDTPVYLEFVIDAERPNLCPPPTDQHHGFYLGGLTRLTILGWEYRHRGGAGAEIHAPYGNCDGPDEWMVFRTIGWTEQEQIDPDAGPPIPWRMGSPQRAFTGEYPFPGRPQPELPTETPFEGAQGRIDHRTFPPEGRITGYGEFAVWRFDPTTQTLVRLSIDR